MSDPLATGFAETLSLSEAGNDEEFEMGRRLLAIWSRLPGPIPRRSDIDPIELGPRLLPRVVILQVLDRGRDYRWRIFGSAHAEYYGRDLTGYRLSEVEAGNPSGLSLRHVLDRTVTQAAPTFFRLIYRSGSGTERRASGIMLPLRETTQEPQALIGCAAWR